MGGCSPVAQWLGFWAFTAVAWVQSLIGEQIPQSMCHGQKKIDGTVFKQEVVFY